MRALLCMACMLAACGAPAVTQCSGSPFKSFSSEVAFDCEDNAVWATQIANIIHDDGLGDVSALKAYDVVMRGGKELVTPIGVRGGYTDVFAHRIDWTHDDLCVLFHEMLHAVDGPSLGNAVHLGWHSRGRYRAISDYCGALLSVIDRGDWSL